MKPIAGIALVAALVFAKEARADDTSASSVRLETGFGTWVSHGSDSNLRQTRFTLAPEFDYANKLRLAPFVRMTDTEIDLLQKNDMSFDASLSLPWQPSLGARVSYDVFQAWRLHFILVGEFDIPLGENRARIESFTPRGKIADQQIDLEALRNHVTIDHRWRTLQGALRVKGDIGWAHPYVDLGYMSIDGRLAVNFDQTSSTMLKGANLSPDRHYDAGGNSFYYMVGTEIDLGKGFQLRLNGTMIPTGSRTFYAGEAFLVIPLNLHFGK